MKLLKADKNETPKCPDCGICPQASSIGMWMVIQNCSVNGHTWSRFCTYAWSSFDYGGNLVWSITHVVRKVGYMSEWDPLEDPEVVKQMKMLRE